MAGLPTNDPPVAQIRAKQSLASGFSPQQSRSCVACGTLARVPLRKLRPWQQPSHRPLVMQWNLRKQSPDLLRNRLSQCPGRQGHLPTGRVLPPPAPRLRQASRQRPLALRGQNRHVPDHPVPHSALSPTRMVRRTSDPQVSRRRNP